MALNVEGEEVRSITTLNRIGIVSMAGPLEVSIQGTFSAGSPVLTHYTRNSLGRGAAVRTATSVIEAYGTTVLTNEFVLTGGDGSTAIDIVVRKIPTAVKNA